MILLDREKRWMSSFYIFYIVIFFPFFYLVKDVDMEVLSFLSHIFFLFLLFFGPFYLKLISIDYYYCYESYVLFNFISVGYFIESLSLLINNERLFIIFKICYCIGIFLVLDTYFTIRSNKV